jgi:predicted TIM-barrel fold metal-dependent hydrolase
MRNLANQPNVSTKLSGFGTFLHRNDRDHIARLVRETVGFFGSHRCLFGSNFPIEKLWTDYGALFDAHRSAARALGPVAYDDVFSTTARRIYRL